MSALQPRFAVVLIALGALLLSACGNDAKHLATPGTASVTSSVAPPPSSASGATRPSPTPIQPGTRVEIALARRRFERAKIAIDGLSDVTPDLHDWDAGGVFQQGRFLASQDERLAILVRAHGDETLDGFLRDHASYSLSKPSSLQICGRSATLVRATREEQHIACVIVSPPGHNHPAYIPPIEIAAVAFEHDHLGVVLTVEIAAADPSLYRPVVDRIIASIACL